MEGDHKNSSAFWAALKVQPIIQSGVQTWKALILVYQGSQRLLMNRFTRLCKRDTNLHCTLATAGDTNNLRREAANQTQWFDGIIRTVGQSLGSR